MAANQQRATEHTWTDHTYIEIKYNPVMRGARIASFVSYSFLRIKLYLNLSCSWYISCMICKCYIKLYWLLIFLWWIISVGFLKAFSTSHGRAIFIGLNLQVIIVNSITLYNDTNAWAEIQPIIPWSKDVLELSWEYYKVFYYDVSVF